MVVQSAGFTVRTSVQELWPPTGKELIRFHVVISNGQERQPCNIRQQSELLHPDIIVSGHSGRATQITRKRKERKLFEPQSPSSETKGTPVSNEMRLKVLGSMAFKFKLLVAPAISPPWIFSPSNSVAHPCKQYEADAAQKNPLCLAPFRF